MTRWCLVAALWIGLLPYVLIESVVEWKEKKLMRASEACASSVYRGEQQARSEAL